MMPAFMWWRVNRYGARDWFWMPICVVSFFSAANAASSRASASLCVRGFCVNTCFPSFIAAIVAG